MSTYFETTAACGNEFGEWFADVVLDVEEPKVVVPDIVETDGLPKVAVPDIVDTGGLGRMTILPALQ